MSVIYALVGIVLISMCIGLQLLIIGWWVVKANKDCLSMHPNNKLWVRDQILWWWLFTLMFDLFLYLLT